VLALQTMKAIPRFFFLISFFALSLNAQPMPSLPAAAAKCVVADVRQVGLEKLARMNCPENKLSMQVWLPPREKADWLTKSIWTNVIPMGMGQDVHISAGRTPRSDYTKPKPVHLLIIAANTPGGTNNAGKVTATLVSLTFH